MTSALLSGCHCKCDFPSSLLQWSEVCGCAFLFVRQQCSRRKGVMTSGASVSHGTIRVLRMTVLRLAPPDWYTDCYPDFYPDCSTDWYTDCYTFRPE